MNCNCPIYASISLWLSGSPSSKFSGITSSPFGPKMYGMCGELIWAKTKKGFSAVSQFIEGKSLKSIAVTLGEANIDVILQKVDTGELEIVSAEPVENADGTFSIVLIVKPPTQGDNQ